MRVLYLESVAGIAGDMFSAAFVDAGLVSAEELQSLPQQLGLGGVEVRISSVVKATMRATHLNVELQSPEWKQKFQPVGEHGHMIHYGRHDQLHSHVQGDEHWHTHYSQIKNHIEVSSLTSDVKGLALQIFYELGVAEADCHGVDLDDVAFHEVGAVDSILDVVMAAYCICKVKAHKIFASPVKLGRGTVTMEHGTHPVPPPAAAKLVRDMPVDVVPAAIVRDNVELSTPTGLAILKAVRPQFHGSWPAGVVRFQGMGAGTMDLGVYPNVFRVSLIEEGVEIPARETGGQKLPYLQDEVVEVAVNLDDMTPEKLGRVSEMLLARGALDVWQTSAVGKKNRVTICLSVLAPQTAWASCADLLLRETTTFGVRYRPWSRLKLDRKYEVQSVGGRNIRVKVGMDIAGKQIKFKSESDDVGDI